MKVIEKERTQVQKYNIYEAADGCTFDTQEECEKYEQTAKFVLRAKFKKLVVKESTEWGFFNVGSDEDIAYALKLTKEADADVVFQLLCLDHPYLKEEACEERRNRAYNLIYGALKDDDILFVGEDYDGYIYIITSRNAITTSLNSFGHEKA